MDVLFINAQEAFELSQEVNGQLLLGTLLLQEGFDVDVLRFCQVEGFKENYELFIDHAVQMILACSPKAVSFYSLWPGYHTMLRIARQIKAVRPDIYTVMGGPQAAATAEDTMNSMPYVDFVCTGEGESTVVPFFTALLRNNAGLDSIPGLYYRENGKVVHNDAVIPLCDLNALPKWDDRLYMKHYQGDHKKFQGKHYYMPIDAGRGCPFSCTFCCTSGFWRRTYRLKSPERIVSDIQYFNEKFGITSFWFSHDAFTSNHKLVEKVCDYIIEKGLKIHWKCSSRIDCIPNELIDKMKKAGLDHIELGVETGSKRMQKLINKNLNLDIAREKVKYLLYSKLYVELFFMYGFPQETEEDLTDTLNLLMDLLDLGVKHVTMAMCRFNPETQLTQEYFQDLVYNKQVDMLSRAVYGYKNEIDTITANPSIFPFYYNLDTLLRNNYQYVGGFIHFYHFFPNAVKYLRRLYNGDPLSFYRDFEVSNPTSFVDVEQLAASIRQNALQMALNTVKKKNPPKAAQLCSLFEFEADLKAVSSSKKDITIQKIYDFNYVDFKFKQPLETFADEKTEILLKKENGVLSMKVLKMIAD